MLWMQKMAIHFVEYSILLIVSDQLLFYTHYQGEGQI